MKRFVLLLAAAATLWAQGAEDTKALLDNRTSEAAKAVGIVAGILDSQGRTVYASGRMAAGNAMPLDGDTIFEIGSITKVFTSLLLADMAGRGEVKLDDPVAKYLPAGVTVPASGERQITLLDLSMQVSGLPRMPSNFKPTDPNNPFADYTPSLLYEFLSNHKLARLPGEKYEYSNVGVGLLGHALARRAGLSYEDLLKRRVLTPLGMTSTSIVLSEGQKRRLAPGHLPDLKPTANWDLDSLAGAGALRSTVNDMLKFLAAAMELTDTPLKAAFATLRSQHRPTGVKELEIALGWHVSTWFDGEVWWHNGGTGGYRTWAGFDPRTRRAAVVLCNTNFSVDDLGLHFVNAQYQVAKIAPPRSAVTLPRELLSEYAGTYALAPTFSIAITAEGDRLFAQATGQPKFELFGEKKDEVFLRVVEAQISFQRDAEGKVSGLVLHQGGRDTPGKKQ